MADKASSPPGYGGTKILVRKDHLESGRYRELKDLKGMKFAMNAPGVSNLDLEHAAQIGRAEIFRRRDRRHALPDHVAALKNKSVDASASVEPGPALAIRNGDAVLIKSDDEILPNHQIAVLLYAEEFATKRPAAARQFMRAYIRAVRFYNGALANGRLDGANADEVIAILSEATPIKSREIYKLITPTGMNPDGRVNKSSLAYDLAFYTEQGLLKGAVNLDDAIDGSFVEAAVKELGPIVVGLRNRMENVLLARTASMRERIAMYNANALKIGVFGANCSSGRSATKVPERWSASWPDCARLARMADEAGIDFMLPIGRWKGYGGETDFHGSTLETVTWAVGLLSVTQRMTVFGTVHVPCSIR